MVRWKVRDLWSGYVVRGDGVEGWRVMKCSWGAVLVADLVTQLPELANLAAGKASAGDF